MNIITARRWAIASALGLCVSGGVAAASASTAPQGPVVWVGISRSCVWDADKTMQINYRLEERRGNRWTWLEDKGYVQTVQVLDGSGRTSGPTDVARWIDVKSVSGGEGVRRVSYTDYSPANFHNIRVVYRKDKVTVIGSDTYRGEACPAS